MKNILLLFIISFSSFAQIDRVEPPFWWSDMNHSDVEIMFYGKNIAQNEVSVSNDVIIKNIKKTENSNYLFVTIDTKNTKAQELVFTFKNNKKTFTHPYSIKQRRQNSSTRKGFDASDVIYLIMPDRFANGNTTNDSTKDTKEKANRNEPSGRHGGDIQGIISNLDYIEQLGATAIWSTPLCEDNDEKYSYHGYAQSDVYKIDSRYGNNEDYVKLSAELKKRNMKLIMDYVTNHWGITHWMINDLPTYDWIHQFPGYGQTSYRMSTQFDPNVASIDAKNCMDGWFVKSMPDLNQSNPLTLNYLIQNAIWWIEYADLDGFRVDTYSYGDKTGMANWTKSIMNEYPNFNIVGEVWFHDQAQIAYWQKDSKIAAIQSYNSNLPSVMDFTLHDAIADVFKQTKQEWNKGLINVYDNFVNDFLYPNIDNVLVFTENHDTARINHLYPKFEDYKLATTLIATIRGIPQIYYGSEIGMQGDKNKGDADIRHDFPGGWSSDTNNAFSVKGRTKNQNQYFDFTSKLFNWRKNKNVIHSGKTKHYLPQNNVYVYFRYNENESVMIVMNNDIEKHQINNSHFQESIKNYKLGKDVLTGKTFDLSQDILIDGKAVLILELN